jgi:hypothetical protein
MSIDRQRILFLNDNLIIGNSGRGDEFVQLVSCAAKYRMRRGRAEYEVELNLKDDRFSETRLKAS